MNKTRAEKALEFFEAEMSRGKCFDECPQCNAMECAIEALKEYIAAEKISHCKDCKNFVNCETYCYCEEYGGFVKDSDYCSRGEIKVKRGEGSVGDQRKVLVICSGGLHQNRGNAMLKQNKR